MWARIFIEAIKVGQKNAMIAGRGVYRREPLQVSMSKEIQT